MSIKVKELIKVWKNVDPESEILVRLDGAIFPTDSLDEHLDYNQGDENGFYILALRGFKNVINQDESLSRARTELAQSEAKPNEKERLRKIDLTTSQLQSTLEPGDGSIDNYRTALPPDYIDPEHTGLDRKLLEVFYQACGSEGGTADEIHLRGLRAVLDAAAHIENENKGNPGDV